MNNETAPELTKLASSLDHNDRSQTFDCERRQHVVSERECMDNFTDAHALRKQTDKCWACRVGAKLRVEYANELDATEERIEACVLLASRVSPPAWAYQVIRIKNK